MTGTTPIRYLGAALAASLLLAAAAGAQSNDADLASISLGELLNLQVSSAAKYEQSTHEAPASVTVITDANTRRYGYLTLAQA